MPQEIATRRRVMAQPTTLHYDAAVLVILECDRGKKCPAITLVYEQPELQDAAWAICKAMDGHHHDPVVFFKPPVVYAVFPVPSLPSELRLKLVLNQFTNVKLDGPEPASRVVLNAGGEFDPIVTDAFFRAYSKHRGFEIRIARSGKLQTVWSRHLSGFRTR